MRTIPRACPCQSVVAFCFNPSQFSNSSQDMANDDNLLQKQQKSDQYFLCASIFFCLESFFVIHALIHIARFNHTSKLSGKCVDVSGPALHYVISIRHSKRRRMITLSVADQTGSFATIGPTTWKGQFAIRISVSSAATTKEDVEISLATIGDIVHQTNVNCSPLESTDRAGITIHLKTPQRPLSG